MTKAMNQRPVLLGIAGGSGCGKTYLAKKVREGREAIVSLLSMDQYFRTESTGNPTKINFDHPAHLDLDLMIDHLCTLKDGKPVRVPAYDFRSMIQQPESTVVNPAPVIIVEGLFVLSSPVLECFDLTCFLDVDDDQRLLGRILRDLEERDSSIAAIVDRYQRFVRPSYHVFVAPSKQNADIVVDFTYRRNFFTQLLAELVSDVVRDGFDLDAFVADIRNESYRLGYKAKDSTMPMAIDIRALARAYPESAYPPSAPSETPLKPKLFLEDKQ